MPQNYVYDWDAAIADGQDKTSAHLIVEKDEDVVVYVGSRPYVVTYRVDGVGSTVRGEVVGKRPKQPGGTPRDDGWTDKVEPFSTSPVNVNGGDFVKFIITPPPEQAVDHWLIKEGTKPTEKDYKTTFSEQSNQYEKRWEVHDNYDVVVKFRDYYLLKFNVTSGENTGKLDLVKVERGSLTLTLQDLEEMQATDIAGNPLKDKNGNTVILGYKIKNGDKITFKATPATNYELEGWSGIGSTPNPPPLEATVTVTHDLNVGVEFI